MCALEWTTLALAAGFYVLFIGRTSFLGGGERYFTLFDYAMISMRYARNPAEGNGLIWNVGEAVEGYTNFLWTAWMAVLHLVGLPESKVSLAVMVSGLALLLANALVVRAIARRLAPDQRWVVLLALVLVALDYTARLLDAARYGSRAPRLAHVRRRPARSQAPRRGAPSG